MNFSPLIFRNILYGSTDVSIGKHHMLNQSSDLPDNWQEFVGIPQLIDKFLDSNFRCNPDYRGRVPPITCIATPSE